jgi:hypothetical protein
MLRRVNGMDGMTGRKLRVALNTLVLPKLAGRTAGVAPACGRVRIAY